MMISMGFSPRSRSSGPIISDFAPGGKVEDDNGGVFYYVI
jgi:hypothetical protein